MDKGIYFAILEYGFGAERFTRREINAELLSRGFSEVDVNRWLQLYMDQDLRRATYGLIFVETLRAERSDDSIYTLSATAQNAWMDFLELKEAQKTGERALYLAIASLLLASLVGVAQIGAQLYPEITKSVIGNIGFIVKYLISCCW